MVFMLTQNRTDAVLLFAGVNYVEPIVYQFNLSMSRIGSLEVGLCIVKYSAIVGKIGG